MECDYGKIGKVLNDSIREDDRGDSLPSHPGWSKDEVSEEIEFMSFHERQN